MTGDTPYSTLSFSPCRRESLCRPPFLSRQSMPVTPARNFTFLPLGTPFPFFSVPTNRRVPFFQIWYKEIVAPRFFFPQARLAKEPFLLFPFFLFPFRREYLKNNSPPDRQDVAAARTLRPLPSSFFTEDRRSLFLGSARETAR